MGKKEQDDAMAQFVTPDRTPRTWMGRWVQQENKLTEQLKAKPQSATPPPQSEPSTVPYSMKTAPVRYKDAAAAPRAGTGGIGKAFGRLLLWVLYMIGALALVVGGAYSIEYVSTLILKSGVFTGESAQLVSVAAPCNAPCQASRPTLQGDITQLDGRIIQLRTVHYCHYRRQGAQAYWGRNLGWAPLRWQAGQLPQPDYKMGAGFTFDERHPAYGLLEALPASGCPQALRAGYKTVQLPE